MDTIVAVPVKKANELVAPITQHWMKARIDAPLAVMDRLDQNAKQMIALAAGLQAVLTAVIKLAGITDKGMLSLAIVSFALLFLSTICSAFLLFQQPAYTGLKPIVSFLEQDDPVEIVRLFGGQVEQMCKEFDSLLRRKKHLLVGALGLFAASMLTSIGCLVLMMN